MRNWLWQQTRERGKAAALAEDDASISYADLAELAACHAAVLAESGVRPGDHVLIQAQTSLRSAIWLHAILWLGAVTVPLDPKLPCERTRKIVERFRPAAFISPNSERLGDVNVDPCPVIDAGKPPDPGLTPVEPATYDPARRATVMLTSGSTREPKAVPLTLENHLASTLAIARRLGMTDSDQWLLCLPINHIGGLAILIRSVITGSAVCIQPNFDPAVILHELAAKPHTLTSMVPSMLQRLVEAHTGPVSARLRALLVGGAPAAPALLERARKLGWPAVPTWGMTEACSQLATMSPHEAVQTNFEALPGIAGPPLPGVEVRIGPSGTLQIRGPMVYSGYLDTADAGPDVEGWFSTDDTGEIMPDGNLRITGRADDVIISGGVNVNLEAARQRLAECSLIGDIALVVLEDPRWGQRIGAVVKPRGVQADKSALVSLLIDWSRKRLVPAERPLQWRIVDQIPANAAGKPLKPACAALFEDD